MKKLEPWIWKISELAVGLVVGYLIWLTDPKHETNTLIASLSVGTLIALVFEVFRTSFWHEEKFEDVNSRVEQKFKEVDSRLEENFKKVDALDTRSSEIFLRLAALAGGDVKTIAKAWVDKEIPRDEMSKVWRQLSWAMQTRYRSTTFMESEKMYARGFSKAVMAIQGAKREENVSVAKVIIFKDPQELKNQNLEKIIEHHKDVGITMKFIDEKTIRETFTLNDKLAKLSYRTLQFALFDDEVAFVWELNGRELIQGRVLVNSDECKKYSEFYDALERHASPLQ
jgi:hypothetical protein